jgi:hypothetical protein
METITFEAFPKLARLRQNVTITEKLDGTNAQVIITDHGDIGAASRNRLIYPGDDNFGFARWVEGNKDELLKLGPGRHFGEWYGLGIQRGYGLKEKRFALFNVARWGAHNPNTPEIVQVVPTLATSAAPEAAVSAMATLAQLGSSMVPGFMNPEGIVVYMHASKTLYKQTFEYDKGKWTANV